jgi:hypothetical protein
MKTGRNDLCPCGSGKKYKRCCMDNSSKQHAEIFDDIAQVMAMNPSLTLDDLNVVLQQRMAQQNNRPNPDFCGLSPNQMTNWLYAPFSERSAITISTPNDLSTSPVMRYLALMLDEAMQQEGSFKATVKGNLPAKLVKQATELLPEFAIAKFDTPMSINEFGGSSEDKFNALHYTRLLAEIAGIIYLRSGRFHVKKAAQKQYQSHGLNAFFLPMLEAAVTGYNWGYLDAWGDHLDLRIFWVFMLWRLQHHASIDQLTEEFCLAFPDFLHQFPSENYFSPRDQLQNLIESRFVERFLQFWGFVTVDPRQYSDQERLPRTVDIQLLLNQSFRFSV